MLIVRLVSKTSTAVILSHYICYIGLSYSVLHTPYLNRQAVRGGLATGWRRSDMRKGDKNLETIKSGVQNPQRKILLYLHIEMVKSLNNGEAS